MSRCFLVFIAVLAPILFTAQSCVIDLSPPYTDPSGAWIGVVYLPSQEAARLSLDVFGDGTVNGSITFTNSGFTHTITDGEWDGYSLKFQVFPWVNHYKIDATVDPEFRFFTSCGVSRWNGGTDPSTGVTVSAWYRVGGCRFNRPLAP